MLRAETSRSLSPAVGVDDIQNLTVVIQRVQETLYDEYDWPHMREVFSAVPLLAGQRYYDLPTGLNYDRIEEASIRISTMPVPFQRGIDFSCYAAFDSDAGVRASPAIRWDIRSVAAAEQIEVWPIPSDNSSSMQFKGIRKLRRLVDNDDVADLDDRLIVLFAAAEILAHSEAPDAKMKLSAAQALLARLKGRSAAASPTIRLGMGRPEYLPYRATLIIGGR